MIEMVKSFHESLTIGLLKKEVINKSIT